MRNRRDTFRSLVKLAVSGAGASIAHEADVANEAGAAPAEWAAIAALPAVKDFQDKVAQIAKEAITQENGVTRFALVWTASALLNMASRGDSDATSLGYQAIDVIDECETAEDAIDFISGMLIAFCVGHQRLVLKTHDLAAAVVTTTAEEADGGPT